MIICFTPNVVRGVFINDVLVSEEDTVANDVFRECRDGRVNPGLIFEFMTDDPCLDC